MVAKQKWGYQGLTILQVKQTRLTNIFHFTAGLTDLCLFEAHASAWTPSEHSEGACTNLMRGERRRSNAAHLATEIFSESLY